MKKINAILVVMFTILLCSAMAFAQTAPVEIPADQFFGQIIDMIRQFGGLSWAGKIAAIVLILIASMKVSFLRPLWDKLGKAKPWAAPVLGLIAGVLSLTVQGSLSFSGVMAYLIAGAGAVLLSEMLELVKVIPGIGPMYVAVINWIQSKLGAPVAAQIK
jgi:hypothetical protein